MAPTQPGSGPPVLGLRLLFAPSGEVVAGWVALSLQCLANMLEVETHVARGTQENTARVLGQVQLGHTGSTSRRPPPGDAQEKPALRCPGGGFCVPEGHTAASLETAQVRGSSPGGP